MINTLDVQAVCDAVQGFTMRPALIPMRYFQEHQIWLARYRTAGGTDITVTAAKKGSAVKLSAHVREERDWMISRRLEQHLKKVVTQPFVVAGEKHASTK